MHGIIGRLVDIPTASDSGDGWEPYIPSIFKRREVIRQIGHMPTLYVMRKREGGKSFYRVCTAAELSSIEKRDVDRHYRCLSR